MRDSETVLHVLLAVAAVAFAVAAARLLFIAIEGGRL